MKQTTRCIITLAAASALFAVAPAATAGAANSNGGSSPLVAAIANLVFVTGLLGPAQTGQPNQSCEDNPTTPGNSATAPGSAFNTSGKAGTVYAGEQPQNSRNSASVSQYDV